MPLNPQTFEYHANKIERLLKYAIKAFYEKRYSDANTIIHQCMDLLKLCEDQTRDILWFQVTYPGITFQELEPNGDVKYKIFHKDYELTRDQAINLRNRLIADGLVWFYISYEGNGRIDWDTKDEPDYLIEFTRLFSPIWRIKRSEGDPTNYFFTYANSDIDVDKANEMATNVKRLYPRITPIVYYGPLDNRGKVIGRSFDSQIDNEIVPNIPGIDVDPRDT